MPIENVGYVTTGTNNYVFGVDEFGMYWIPLGYSICVFGGTTTTIKARVKRSGGSGTCTMIGGIWESDTILGYTNEITFSSESYAWRTLTLTSPVELEASHWYMVGVGVKYLSPSFVISGENSGGVGFEQYHVPWPPSDLETRFGDDIYNVYATSSYASVPDTLKVNIGDDWKEGDEVKINIGDDWKDVIEMKQNIGDSWKII